MNAIAVINVHINTFNELYNRENCNKSTQFSCNENIYAIEKMCKIKFCNPYGCLDFSVANQFIFRIKVFNKV